MLTKTTAARKYAVHATRFGPAFRDVIVHEPHAHGKAGPVTRVSSPTIGPGGTNHMTLGGFARRHFGSRRFAVVQQVAPARSAARAVQDRGAGPGGTAPVFPSYVCHV